MAKNYNMLKVENWLHSYLMNLLNELKEIDNTWTTTDIIALAFQIAANSKIPSKTELKLYIPGCENILEKHNAKL